MSNFGKTEKSYDVEKVLEMINNGNSEEIKTYISFYFIKLATVREVLFWNPSEKRYVLFDDFIIKTRYFTPDLSIFTIIKVGNKGKKIKTWDLYNWFYSASNPCYFPCSKVNK